MSIEQRRISERQVRRIVPRFDFMMVGAGSDVGTATLYVPRVARIAVDFLAPYGFRPFTYAGGGRMAPWDPAAATAFMLPT